MFVFVSSLVCQNAYPQQDKFDSELGLFLKEKNYEAIQLGRFITGHLYLTAEVNGTNATFVLDTGAGSTVMEEKKESKFNLTTSLSESKAVGAGGNNLALKETSIKNFCIKNYVLHDYKIHLMNLDHVNNAFKKVGYLNLWSKFQNVIVQIAQLAEIHGCNILCLVNRLCHFHCL